MTIQGVFSTFKQKTYFKSTVQKISLGLTPRVSHLSVYPRWFQSQFLRKEWGYAGVVLLRSALTPSYDLLPSFVSNMYVVHFFRISSTLLTCPVELQEFILAHMDSQTRFFATVCCRGWKVGKRFSTYFSRVWSHISEFSCPWCHDSL